MLLIQADSFPFSLTGPLSYSMRLAMRIFESACSVRLMNISNSNLTAGVRGDGFPPLSCGRYSYVIVMTVSVVLYKRLGLSNTDIALYTSWLYLPWVIKPLWSPLVDMLRTKRFLDRCDAIAGRRVSGLRGTDHSGVEFYPIHPGFFWVMAFNSATHDIAADGFICCASEHQQAPSSACGPPFYRIATIAAKGGLVILAGYLETHGFTVTSAWSVTLFAAAASSWRSLFIMPFVLPCPVADRPAARDVSQKPSDPVLHSLAIFFQAEGCQGYSGFPAFVPLCRGPTGEDGGAFSSGSPDKRRSGIDDQ